MITRNIKRSVCPCGYNTLRDEIPLGTEYDVDPSRVLNVVYRCGGCGQSYPVRLVFSKRIATGVTGYIPIDLFDLQPETSKD